MHRPGGITYHHAPALGAPDSNAFSSIVPHEIRVGSPRPRNDSAASERIATATISTVLAKISGSVFGQDVLADDVGVAGAERPGALDERPLAQGQHLRPHDPSRPGPRRQPDHRDQHRQRRVQQPRQDDHQRQRRDDQEPVLERVEAAVGPAAEVAADEPDDRAQHRRDQRRGEADDDRDPRADQDLREDVGAVLGRPERCGSSSAAPARRGSTRRGRTGAIRLPKIAMKTNSATTPSPMRPRHVPSSRSRTPLVVVADLGRSGADQRRAAACSGSRRLHPRVEVEVEAVGEQVGQDHPGGEDQERPLEHREVLVLDRLEAELAQPGQEKIVSIVIAPPTTAPNWIADSVTSGSSAFGHRVAAHDPLPGQARSRA